MIARAVLAPALAAAIACGSGAPRPEPAPPAAVDAARAPPPGDGGATIRRTHDGRCEPMPRQGDACGAGDGYCVVDWGTPGGHSTALWCRDGRWEIETEVNLPAEPR